MPNRNLVACLIVAAGLAAFALPARADNFVVNDGGYSVDIARRLADDLGVQLAFVETSWPDVIPQLLSQRSDLLLTGLWKNVPRALVVNFTQPTITEGLYLFGATMATAGFCSSGSPTAS